ncbi:hypothetical protein UFOVP245_57 [uncultured Caudovirales phage]|uniref:Uncharacterized protein n=1 Tax=uncultured Caudovirales phage TaxID=2100421 RepID=A0A6J7WTD8_9CAUD|nr:hypothetical protein UFOVP245_57 [uncultured Caudovirales phage]
MSDDFENKYRNWHTYWSYLKSTIRIAGCLTVLWIAPFGELISCLAFSFFIAELIGILEEFV